MRKIITSCVVFFLYSSLFGQSQYQYFDGNDTISSETVEFQFSAIPEDVWFVGKPEKTVFNSAFSQPNALFTSKNGGYPQNNQSSFMIEYDPFTFGPGILAMQWTQKLQYQPPTDSDAGDGGYIEFSFDSGATWQNALTSPYVYNFYGYNSNNVATLSNGQEGFVGTDNEWRDIWLCFDQSFLQQLETVYFRFTHISDDNSSWHEGWMIDNFQMHLTLVHTISEKESGDYLKILPNPTNGIVKIQAEKRNDFHIIQNMELINIDGTVVETYGMSPTKFQIDISHHPRGTYYLKVQTNLKTEIHKIVLVD